MIFPDDANHQSARSWLAKLAPHPVTYADAVSFAAMESSGCAEFIGFDNDFLAAGFKKLA